MSNMPVRNVRDELAPQRSRVADEPISLGGGFLTDHDPTLGAQEPAIPYFDCNDARAEIRARLDRSGSQMGFVPNSFRTYRHRPEI
jgi:hypothetical protein